VTFCPKGTCSWMESAWMMWYRSGVIRLLAGFTAFACGQVNSEGVINFWFSCVYLMWSKCTTQLKTLKDSICTGLPVRWRRSVTGWSPEYPRFQCQEICGNQSELFTLLQSKKWQVACRWVPSLYVPTSVGSHDENVGNHYSLSFWRWAILIG
jgi:hypothetical protein